jgi:hypothetical protein
MSGSGDPAVHVIDQRIVPNGRRDHFQPNVHSRRELERREDGFVHSLRTERLLNQTDEAHCGLADICLTDQRQLRSVRSHHRRAEAETDIDGVCQD